MDRLKGMNGRGSKMKFGPKRSCSSLNLNTQLCPEHCESPVIVETHTVRSCGNSPARSRPHHCHETSDVRQCESCECPLTAAAAAEQMISHTSSCPLKRSRSQHFYPTHNRYFNALDAAAGIRAALQSSHQGGTCASNNRSFQRFRLLNPTPTLYNPSNLATCKVEPRCVEDIPQGLATVLCPKFPSDMEFQIQKRAPRGLAAVIADCNCLETGQQSVEHYHSCPQRGLISLPDLQEFHQEVARSSPRNSRMITNIDMVEKIKMPPTCDLGTESVASSRTSIRMETEVQHQDQQQEEQDLEDSCLDYNCDEFQPLEPPLRTSSRWESPPRDLNDDRRSSKRKRSSMRASSFREPSYTEPSMRSSSFRAPSCREPREPSYREPSMRSSSFREPSMRSSSFREPSMRSSGFREPSMPSASFREPSMRRLSKIEPSASYREPSMRSPSNVEPSTSYREPSIRSPSYREPSRQFDLNEEDALREQLQRMSFNEGRDNLPRDSLEAYSSWVPAPDTDRRDSGRLSISVPGDRLGPERLSISLVSETPDLQHSEQENVELEDKRRRASNAEGSSKTSMVSFNQSTPKSSNRGRGSTYTEHRRSSDTKPHNKAIKDVSETENLRNIVQEAVQLAVQEELSMQKAVQKAVQQELKMRSTSSEEQSSESFSHSCTSAPESQKRSHGPSRASSDEQSSYAQIVANARKSQETLEETQAALISRPRSKSTSKRRLSIYKRNGSISTASADECSRGSSISVEISTCKSPDQPGSTRRKPPVQPPMQPPVQPPPQAGISYKDHMASITQLLNSMNSVTQLLNAMPLQGDADRPPEARKSTGPQEEEERSAARMSGQRLSGTREPTQEQPYGMASQQPQFDMGGGSFQQSQYDMGASGSQQPQFNMGGGSFSQPGMGGGSFQQSPYDMLQVRVSQQPQFPMGGGSFQQQPLSNMGGGSFQQQPLNNMGGGSFQQQFDYTGGMNPQQPQWDMGAGIPQGSYSQIPGQQPGYPNPRGSGQGMVQNWDANGMPVGSQFAFDPNRPRSQSMPVDSQSSFALDPNNPQRPRGQSMPVGYDNIQQSRRQSTGDVNRRPSNSRRRSSSMTGQRRSRSSMSRQYSLMNQGQRRSKAIMSRRSNRVSQGRGRSRLSVSNSGHDPNEREMRARSSQVFYNPKSEAYEEMNDAADAIPEGDEGDGDQSESQGEETDQSGPQEGDEPQEGDGDQSEDTQDEQANESEQDESSQQAEGMAANYQPTVIHSETLDQVPQQLQSQVERLNGSSQNPIPTPSPTPPTVPEQFDLATNNPKTITSEETLIETDTAKPNVAQMPLEFQHHLIKMRSHAFQHFEFVKPETYPGRKSLSSIVCAMIQELEVLESRSRQKSAAYEFNSLSSKEYCQKQLHSDIIANKQDEVKTRVKAHRKNARQFDSLLKKVKP